MNFIIASYLLLHFLSLNFFYNANTKHSVSVTYDVSSNLGRHVLNYFQLKGKRVSTHKRTIRMVTLIIKIFREYFCAYLNNEPDNYAHGRIRNVTSAVVFLEVLIVSQKQNHNLVWKKFVLQVKATACRPKWTCKKRQYDSHKKTSGSFAVLLKIDSTTETSLKANFTKELIYWNCRWYKFWIWRYLLFFNLQF